MNKSEKLKKRIRQKLKTLEHKQKESSVFLILATISLIVSFSVLIICFLTKSITITDILSIFLSLIGFIISFTTYFCDKKENLEFQIDFYEFMLQQIEEKSRK